MAEGDGVDEFEARAGGDAGGETGNLGARPGELLGQIKGGGFPAGVGAKAENHFANLVLLGALEQGGNLQFIRSDAVKGGEQSAKDVITALEGSGAFEAEDVGRVFDNAKEGGVAVLVATNLAKPVFAKETALRAGLDLDLGLLDRMGEIFGGADRGGE